MSAYSAIDSNVRKTWLIIVLFIVFLTTLGFVYGKASEGSTALYAFLALGIASVSSIGSYFYADKLVLATAKAKKVSPESYPALLKIVENLSIAQGMPMPQVYLMQDNSLNAFATGRDPKHAVVAVTSGLLETLNKAELEGVIAHELSHVKNYDIRLMTIVAVLVGAIALFADFYLRSSFYRSSSKRDDRAGYVFLLLALVAAILSPIIATLIQLAVSRKREFLADASGVLLTRYPDGLASALEKISQSKTPTHAATNATAHLFISNPFKQKEEKHWFASLFNTHPPIAERIRILRNM